MRRALLAVATLSVLAVAGPAAAGGGPAVEDDEKHICVLLNSEKNEGYCIKTHGVHLPKLPKLPDLPDRP